MEHKFKSSSRVFFLLLFCMFFYVQNSTGQELENYIEIKGTVVNDQTGDPIESVSLNIKDSNIGTITNTDGEFIMKIPKAAANKIIVIANLGFQAKEIALSDIAGIGNEIRLEPAVTKLSEINVTGFKSAEALVRKLFKDRDINDISQPVLMTAFYRETIKRRNRNVSLTEAVVNLYKQPYASAKKDIVELHKARKSTDYRRLDTVALKLQGGPFSTLYLDMMKYPEYIFTDDSIDSYNFAFEPSTTMNGKLVYVVRFDPKKDQLGVGFNGKLFISSENLGLTSASFDMDIENLENAGETFVKKKPRDINVTPKEASYHIDYREKDGKWYYGYGSVSLTFKVDQKGKLFNSNYTISSEMAVTDWAPILENELRKPQKRMKPTVIMSDEIIGFKDPDFWGPYNVIEPEKSIESAISKIQKKLEKGKG